MFQTMSGVNGLNCKHPWLWGYLLLSGYLLRILKGSSTCFFFPNLLSPLERCWRAASCYIVLQSCSPGLSLGMAVSLCSSLSSAKLSGPERGGDSPGLTVWLSASLLTRIQPSAHPEQVPRGKAEALSTVPATLWEPVSSSPFLG